MVTHSSNAAMVAARDPSSMAGEMRDEDSMAMAAIALELPIAYAILSRPNVSLGVCILIVYICHASFKFSLCEGSCKCFISV